ncbi:MAG: DedA family protein, partial [Thermoplasmata archaeon]
LPFSGFLVADGTFSLGGTLLAALAGGLAGSFIAYAVGRWWRDRLAGLGAGYLRIRSQDLDRMDAWFARRGEVTVALARVVPGVRSYISYPAGTAGMSPLRFGLYTFVGTVPWTLGLLYAGIVLRSHWIEVTAYFEPIDITIVVIVVAAITYLILLAAGALASGWPPRRGPRYAHRPGDGPRPPPAHP